MGPLQVELRKELGRTVIAARDEAEAGALAALAALGVREEAPFAGMAPDATELHEGLRARWLALGGDDQAYNALKEEIAYEQWHRMLFARFLAENALLRHPVHGVAVTLAECAELASEVGEPDQWMTAAKFAGTMLPGIFRKEDPSAAVRFAANNLGALETLLQRLPSAVFTADDSLGWVYQFWQDKAKNEVNKSGRKVGGKDLAAVTQLFTEDYMVRFLLENSLGAWWAGKHPQSPLLKEWVYLRYRDDGAPAAGAFPDWPKRVAEVTVMDPCCGSGHFLVVAFDMLRKMRMEEDGLSEVRAGDAVLRDNLFGLEIDARCTQIAAFALALAAWKAGGYRELPLPSIACSGIRAQGEKREWGDLGGSDKALRFLLRQLFDLFRNAPDLGSLINPRLLEVNFPSADFSKVAPLLRQALAQGGHDPVSQVFGAAAEGMARAGDLLGRRYTLVATNVPYLARGKQGHLVKSYVETAFPEGKQDLATVFLQRARGFTAEGGSYALVTPWNWLFLTSYKELRIKTLRDQSLVQISWLGPRAFETISGEVVKVSLVTLSNRRPEPTTRHCAIEASTPKTASGKAELLRTGPVTSVLQSAQAGNPESRIIPHELAGSALLAEYADSLQGISPADLPHYGRWFWEVRLEAGWRFWQSTPEITADYGGREHVLWWNTDLMNAVERGSAFIRGREGWGKLGVSVAQMGDLPCTLYTGEVSDTNTATIIPVNTAHLPAIWAFCSSPEFARAVRQIDKKMNVTNATLVQVPFDLGLWQRVAEAAGPLPEPHSDDPTQWLFKGHPRGSEAPLQVAVARLLGYRWPQQRADSRESLAVSDGIACVTPVAGDTPVAERLRSFLAVAYGPDWSPDLQDRLLTDAGSSGKSLEEWLRDDFFAQHCRLFHNRPFIWQIWDGRKDGFSALVNYHKLDSKTLQKLIYTHLGWWIEVQSKAAQGGVTGAEPRLEAAQELKRKLELILRGESPHDVYVRWKPKHRQPIGWEPDLDDGVRLNVRPFVTAGMLRRPFNVNWNKDRGQDPGGGERLNDLHLTLEEKRQARKEAGLGE